MHAEVTEGYKVSPQQKRVWHLQRDGSRYRAVCAILLEGELHTQNLKDAFDLLITRHEILRTTFGRQPGMKLPIQVVRETLPMRWRELDLTASTKQQQAEEVERLFAAATQEELDLEEGPVLSVRFISLAADRWLVMIALPSLCADGRALNNLARDLSRCYEACLLHQPLLDEPIQYADFSSFQNELLNAEDEDAQAARAHWRKQQIGSVSPLKLPFEREIKQPGRFVPFITTLEIGREITTELQAVAIRYASRPEEVLLASWQALIWRLSGRSEADVREQIGGRKYEELEDGVGLFAKAVPVLVHMHGKLRFNELLQQVQESRRLAAEWQEYFDIEGEAPDTIEAGESSIGFEYEPGRKRYSASGIEFGIYRQYACSERFKIKLRCLLQDELISIELQYDSRIFQPESVERIAGHFQTILNSVVHDPGALISELDILSESDRHELLRALNQTDAYYPEDRTIPDLFEEQAERTPDTIAVIGGGRQLTYAKLNTKANQLANLLRRKGVTQGVRVGFCVDRSVDMVVGMLGILKAGGAYVPLNSEYPKERLIHEIKEIQTPLLLTQEKLLGELPDFDGTIVCLDRDQSLYATEQKDNPLRAATPQDLVYVIYTSGSSGKPKGVAITHQNLINYTYFICRELKLVDVQAPQQLQFATVSTMAADLGNTAIFPSLVSGGCLHILSYEVTTDANLFAEYMTGQGIDILKIVPSHLSALITDSEGARVLPRKYLILGGETLSLALMERLGHLSPSCKIVNHYGPTEATIGALINHLDDKEDGHLEHSYSTPASVPIGRPIANAQAYVLDEELRLVPVGVAGELYLGGAGLARGYLNQPAETAERFVPNPYSDDENARLYKTGDLTRYLPGGKVEFLGRTDDQVKIRGFRVEIGEIEAVLSEHARVKEAVVVAREDEPGHKRLVAYVVADRKPALAVGDLQSHCKEKLPDYMMPSAFVVLERLPLTPNGKIDRRALPAPGQARAESSRIHVAPRNDVERLLTDIWQDALRVEQVSIDDNFFELGGDSILSIQIVARAREAGLHLTPKHLFQCQTIAELSSLVTYATAIRAEQGPVAGAVPLTPIQRWFFQQRSRNLHHFNQAVLLHVPPDVDAALLRQAVASLHEHHDALRLRFTLAADEPRQFHADAAEAAPFTQVDLSDVEESELSAAIETEATTWQRSLHLSDGPIFRSVLFSLGSGKAGRLLIVAHHLVVDGVSWRILLDDLQLAYEQLQRGDAVKLPAKTTSFKQWAQRLFEYAKSEAVTAQTPYWTGVRRDITTGLPVDYPDGHNSRATARTITVALNEAETEALLKDVPGTYQTEINDALLTALVISFGAWSGCRALPVEMEGHGREEIADDLDVTRTVGWFTTHYPVLLRIGENAGVGEAFKQIKEQLRAAPQHGLGYGLLRWMRGGGQADGLQDAAQAQVKFNYLGQLDRALVETSAFGMASEPSGEWQDKSGQRSHLLEINGAVTGRRLRLRWVYSEDTHRPETIERLAASYMAELRGLIQHCRSADAGGYTPSDFSASRLDQKELDKFIAGLDSSKGEKRNLEDIYRLSPMQEGFLFHSLYAPESDVYFRQMSCSLHGDLRAAAFEKAWQTSVDQHPALRTSFYWKGLEAPLQVVSKRVKLPLTQHDWRELSPAEQGRRLELFLDAERGRGFDLTKAPVMRLVLIRLAEDVHHFIWSYHHLLMDGWSKHLVFNQILAVYSALSHGQELALEDSRPYGAYIEWLQLQDMNDAEAFWRQALKGFTSPGVVGAESLTGSSADKTNGDEPRSDKQRRLLSEKATEALHNQARQNQLTLNTLVQGAWALLLSRYSGQSDVVFASVVSGRPANLRGAEKMIGLFINTLPVRAQIEGDAKGLEWLKQLQEQQVDMRQYEYSPLVKVQGWSEVPRGASLFESVLAFENYPVDSSERARNMMMEVRDVRVIENNNYPLTLMVGPATRLSLLLIYDSRRFDAPTIADMLNNLETLLISIAGLQADSRVGDLQAALDEAILQQRITSENEIEQVRLQKLKLIKRRAVHT